MKYDFTTVLDRHGRDSLAFDKIPFAGVQPDEGFDTIPMWIADMSFVAAPPAMEAILKRMEMPNFGYFALPDEYFDSIINWQRTRNGVEGLLPEHIGYENGVLGGVSSAVQSFTSPGDKILIHSPTYVGFTHTMDDTGRVIVHSELKRDENGIWRMDYEDMDRKIKENPNGFLDRIECIPTMREHLSQEELIWLAETPCEEDVLKRAFLFACLTGLRKSDIRQLTWQQIQPYTNGKMFVTTRMQKTKQIVHNPISDEAYGLLGERCEGLIFDGFKDKMLQGPLKRWLLAAGITKKITFHCTRHSFGSLHVEMGTDMAVIQAYMGHKNITTTQIYSKMAAQQMCEVVDKITLKRKKA